MAIVGERDSILELSFLVLLIWLLRTLMAKKGRRLHRSFLSVNEKCRFAIFVHN